MSAQARLALCGNVFPAESAAEALAALRGPALEWAHAVRAAGGPARPGFGLYLAASAAAEMRRQAAQRAELRAALAAAGLEAWTANAFPFGGFHGTRVKERAFLPDWTDPARLAFTQDVIEVLADVAPPAAALSISTCPLGYGAEARTHPAAREHLLRARDFCDLWSQRRGAPVRLALEPEPDGAFERVAALAPFLSELEADRAPAARRLAVCWDLCHSAVVGEEPAAAWAALRAHGVSLGKIQVSAALCAPGRVTSAARARLAAFASDPYLHQARALDAQGAPRSWRDLPDFLADPQAESCVQLRVHCHVPVHHADFGDGLTGTPWRAVAAAARAQGLDLELETYTLPVLPVSVRAGRSVPSILAQEFLALCAA